MSFNASSATIAKSACAIEDAITTEMHALGMSSDPDGSIAAVKAAAGDECDEPEED